MTAEEILQSKLDELKTAIEQKNADALQVAIKEMQDKADQEREKLETELKENREKLSALELKTKKQELNSVSGFIKKNNELLKEVAEHIKERKETKVYLDVHNKQLTGDTAIEDASSAVITRTQTNFASNMVLAQQPAVERIDDFDLFTNAGVMLVPITGNGTSVPYIDEVVDGDAAAQTEGSAKADIEPTYVERVASTKTYAGITGVSDQILEDIVQLQMWIFAMLQRKLKIAYNTAFFTGTGVAPNMTGLDVHATAFSSTGLELGAGSAVGIYEVINAAITQARVNNFSVTRVWMNPIDYYKMLSERSDQGRVNSIVELQVMNGYIGSARIQLTNYVAAGSIYLADAEVIKIIYRANNFAMPEIGLNASDFKNNMKSIRAHVRLESVVHENDKGGIIKVSDIDAAITALAADPA